MEYKHNFVKLCNILRLGNLIREPRKIRNLENRSGPEIFCITTTQNKYVVKTVNRVAADVLLNSSIQCSVAKLHETTGLNFVLDKVIDGSSIHRLDGFLYRVMDYIDGETLLSLNHNDITPTHLYEIGKALSLIHAGGGGGSNYLG